MTSKTIPNIAAAAMKAAIPAHSPFMPGNSGGCILALCDEAAQPDVAHKADICLNAARDILYLLIDNDTLDGHTGALYGVTTLVELAEGLIQALLSEAAPDPSHSHRIKCQYARRVKTRQHANWPKNPS